MHNAVLKTDADGRASDVFWVTDLRGRKVGVRDRPAAHGACALRALAWGHDSEAGTVGAQGW